MARKKETITLSIPPGTREELEEIARNLGIFWGKSPSISGLLVAIAQKEFEVGEPFCLNSTQEGALQRAIRSLNDSGYAGEAQTLSRLLLERGDLNNAMRQSILKQVGKPNEQWRNMVEQNRQSKQSFQLLYTNAQQEDFAFTVRYAETSFEEEKGFYLNIWCDETEDIKNPEYPELIHNRCLRFDRVKTILPVKGRWRDEGLDYLEVHLHFLRGMVKAYEPKKFSINQDISNEIVDDVRQVIRKVANPFWLIREVFRYGKDCEIISPPEVRSRFQENLKSLCQAYDLEIKEED